MKEIWKDIPEYEGYYQVSNLGNVKSVSRIVYRKDGKIQTFKERILKPAKSKNYLCVILYKNKIRKNIKVHQLVAMAFLNHIPCGHKIVVDHIDNDKLNNKVENLQLTTNRHNTSKDKKGTSKYTGVCWRKARQKWRARIAINGKLKHLGYFENELDAHEAYQDKLKEIV